MSYRDPTEAELKDPLWNEIWQAIKSWDINVPEEYGGYTGATGNHVCVIYDILRAALAESQQQAAQPAEPMPPEIRDWFCSECKHKHLSMQICGVQVVLGEHFSPCFRICNCTHAYVQSIPQAPAATEGKLRDASMESQLSVLLVSFLHTSSDMLGLRDALAEFIRTPDAQVRREQDEKWIEVLTKPANQTVGLMASFSEHLAQMLAATRREALEEAAKEIRFNADGYVMDGRNDKETFKVLNELAEEVRALAAQPTPARDRSGEGV
jgi:hypothetical protein